MKASRGKVCTSLRLPSQQEECMAKRKRVVDTAPAAAEEKSNCYGNMEEQICDLVRAADLAESLLEDTLSEGRAHGGGPLSVYLPEQFQERLIFAAGEVNNRARALKDFFYRDRS
jgi:hypothetical protein